MIQTTIETVTPQKAEQWLNGNHTNRAMRPGVAEAYASDMRAGRWTQCVAPIAFYADGDLADGQHRLWAIVDTGLSFRMNIMRGLQREDGLNIDTGLTRSLIDNARISGVDKSLSRSLISTARAIEFGTTLVGRTVSNSETAQIVAHHREAASWAVANVRRKMGLSGSTVTGAVGRAYEAGCDRAGLTRFCEVLGSGLYAGDTETAAVMLRNYLLSRRSVASSSGLWRDTFLRAQLAISHFIAHRKVMYLKAPDTDVYPNVSSPNQSVPPRPAAKRSVKAPAAKSTKAPTK